MIDEISNQLITNSEVVAYKLGIYFYTNSSDSNYDDKFSKLKQDKEKNTIQNIINIIPYICKQIFGLKSKSMLLNIFNKIWKNGIFPTTWKNGIIVVLPKPEKNRFTLEG